MVPNLPIDTGQLRDFCRRWHVAELSLFGSVLRDDFRDDSDVDVLVAWEPGARVTMLMMVDMASELAEIMGRPVDLVPRDGLKPAIRDAVLQSAEPLYGAA